MVRFCLISESIIKCHHKLSRIDAALNSLLIIYMFIMLNVLVCQVIMLAFAN